MLWNTRQIFELEPFETEAEIEATLNEASQAIFGKFRIYLDFKKKIGMSGKTQNIPDGYLIDLSSNKVPKLYVVEVELAKHEYLKHIAVQILEFSLSFETASTLLKNNIKAAIHQNSEALKLCQNYAVSNGFENVDFLLEKMIYGPDCFNALVIIDELSDELETILHSRFKFPVEVITLERYKDETGERLYRFEPFLEDVTGEIHTREGKAERIDPSDIDTIVVPAREEGFKEVFIGQNCWYAIRIHSSMLSRLQYIAAYQVSPESKITHIAKIDSIKQWKDTSKYIINFAGPAKTVGPIPLVPKGKIKAPQAPRYTSKAKLENAKTLDDAF